jgi:3-oxoacyl-[acyl-carrier-protein] synthase-3
MTFNTIDNVSIRGISVCVPKNVENNIDLPIFKEGEAKRIIALSGIERKHVVSSGISMTELAIGAFNGLMEELEWERDTIDMLVMVSSAGEFITPSTANILHGALALKETCLCFDIRQGCPGWIVGMHVVSSMLSQGNMHRAVLLCGDISSRMNSPYDKETRAEFGDAITATALEFSQGAPALEFLHGCKGKDYDSIIIPDGGLRNPITSESIRYQEDEKGVKRRKIDCATDGVNVFAFCLSHAPKGAQQMMQYYGINPEDIDCFLLSQSNRFLNEKIRKMLSWPSEKVPYSLRDYGNNSGGSIPLTLVTQRRKAYQNGKMNSVACAFGVGLAWGCLHFQTENIKCAYVEI